MKVENNIRKIFENGALTFEQFEAALKADNIELSKIVDLSSGAYVGKETYTSLENENKSNLEKIDLLEKNKKEAEKELKSLDLTKAEYAELKESFEKREAEYKASIEKYENDKINSTKENALIDLIKSSGGEKNVKPILALIKVNNDFDNITIAKDGTVNGISDIVAKYKAHEDTASLFVSEVQPTENKPSIESTTPNNEPAKIDFMGGKAFY